MRVSARMARSGRVTLGALVLTGCAEPSFVSLGSNLSEQTALAGDAAAPATGPLLPEDDTGEPFMAPDAPPLVCVGDGSVSVEGECASRVRVECVPANEFVPYPLASVLSMLLFSCGAHQNRLTVRFTQGCATGYDLSPPFASDSAACITARLAAERYSCAEALSCEAGETYGIPTATTPPDWY